MKKFFYLLFGVFFRINRIFPVKKNRVALLAPHNGGNHDSLGEVRDYLAQKGRYKIFYIPTSEMSSITGALHFFVVQSHRLATAEYVFLNDNFMPMASLNFTAHTTVTQLWHAEGAFKRFGLLTELTPEIREREIACSSKLNYITCTSENLVPVYADAFGVAKSKVLPLGSPRIDYLFRDHDVDSIRSAFDKKHPECKNKKLILYAPTFRDTPEKDRELLSHIDTKLFADNLGDEYSLLIKLHPQIHSSEPIENSTDVTAEDIADLTLICDMVITDYSSVCMDFALLDKPCIFFAFDLEEYEKERSFCFGYEDYVPGPVVRTFAEVIDRVRDGGDPEKLEKFRAFNFDHIDRNNTERVVAAVIK